ncbi:MAG: YraN family protein [Spirochaetaceae bacterium]|nr:YraN family protein [Spirochaetaceae bacterium]MBQ4555124.1 YraN family protein [Spirochaetaceae bacterium]
MKNLSSKEKGFLGEERVVNFLVNKNYQILFRNWRTKFGEIDIIALDKSNLNGDTLVFLEVKTLPSGNAETLEKELSVTKQKKIVKTSKCFLLEYRQYKYDYIRYDVVVVDMPGQEPIWHIENAFSEYS